jgi:hypothetical protein
MQGVVTLSVIMPNVVASFLTSSALIGLGLDLISPKSINGRFNNIVIKCFSLLKRMFNYHRACTIKLLRTLLFPFLSKLERLGLLIVSAHVQYIRVRLGS